MLDRTAKIDAFDRHQSYPSKHNSDKAKSRRNKGNIKNEKKMEIIIRSFSVEELFGARILGRQGEQW